jgi:hypothetical protein
MEAQAIVNQAANADYTYFTKNQISDPTFPFPTSIPMKIPENIDLALAENHWCAFFAKKSPAYNEDAVAAACSRYHLVLNANEPADCKDAVFSFFENVFTVQDCSEITDSCFSKIKNFVPSSTLRNLCN